MATVEEDFTSLSLDDKLSHKSWKARLSAYTELISLFKQTVSESDPAFRPYLNNPAGVREWVRDSNAVSQEKGVEAVCALVEMSGKSAAKTRPEVVPSLVEKCLGSARAGTRDKALELCLLFVEVEEDQGEGVIADLIPGLEVKQPKVVAGCIKVLSSLVRSFGPKTLSFRPILPLLPKIFSHADKTVRSEGSSLALSLHVYLGPALTPSLGDLKPVQQKELTESFEEVDKGDEGFGKVKQTRWTRTQMREKMVKEAESQLGGALSGAEVGEPEDAEEPLDSPPDPFDFAEPIDILSSLPPDFYTNLSSLKWKDRKELALDPLLTLLNAPKLSPKGNYDELTRALGGRMTDANVLCVVVAANCIERLAKGLRVEFGKYWENVVTQLLGRTKEKKQNVLDAIGSALDAVFATISISQLLDPLLPFLSDKNPSIKSSTLSFLTRSLSSTLSPPPPTSLPPLIEALKTALGDSVEPVRVAAADSMGTLMKVVGERALGGAVEGLDDIRKAKVKEAAEKAVVKCKPGMGGTTTSRAPPPVAVSAAVVKPKPKPSVANKENGPPTPSASSPELPSSAAPTPKPLVKSSGPPARLLAKKPPIASTSSAPTVKKPPPPSTSSSSKTPASSSITSSSSKLNEPLKFRMSQEEADSTVSEFLPETIINELGDSNWKIRLGAIEALQNSLEEIGRMGSLECELVVRFLSKKPGWKESNFQVSAKMFGIFQLLAQESPSFAKGSAALAIPALSDKLGDIKLKKPAGDTLFVFAEKTSLQFVLGQAYEPLTKQKAPKAQADAYLWVEQAVRDFGVVGLAIRELIEYFKVGLKSTNAAVRTSATKALVTLKIFVGADIATFIQDLNPTLLSTIESEFTKVDSETPPEPTRFSADMAVAASSGGGGGGGGGKGKGVGDPLDDLFPRVELEKLIPGSMIGGCGDANWKVRKESLEGIQGILEANKRLKGSTLPELTTALKLRMSDSNKIVQSLALDVVARIATGMGKPFDKIARIFSGPVAGVLADQKVNIRAAGITTLSAMADAAGLDSLIGGFDKPLEAPNPLLRKDLLGFLETRFSEEGVVASCDLSCLAGPILGCLEDKNAEVRKSATAILPAIVARAGYNTVLDHASKLKPASRTTLLPLIEVARANAPPTLNSAPTSKSTSSAPPPPSAPTSSAPAPTISSAKPSLGPARPTAKVLRPTASAPTPNEEPIIAATPSIRARQSIGGFRAKPPPTPRASAPPTPTAREAPFNSSDTDPKRVRALKEQGSLKWVVEVTPRPDQVEALYSQMAPHTSPELLAQLFSKDHSSERDFIAGLTTLDDCAKESSTAARLCGIEEDEMQKRLVANVDVVFKYVTLRIGMTSTTITVKCLDLVEHLIGVLDIQGHKLSDYETSALLLSLINKVGDGKETIRQRVRTLFKSICEVYPFSKVFNTLLENGLSSKNARTRAESAEEIGSLFQRHGVSPFALPKALPLLAKLISDRDPAVRTAALTAIGAVYTLVGSDGVYKYIGAIPDKERTMLEERLKRTTSSAPASAPASRVATPPIASTSRVATPPPPSHRPSPPASPRPPSSASSIPSSSRPAGIPAPRGIPSSVSRIGTGARPPSIQVPTASSLGIPQRSSVPSPRLSVTSGLPTRQSITRPGSSSLGLASGSRLIPRPKRDTAEDDLPLSTSPEETSRLVEAIVTSDLARSADVLKRVQREIAEQPDFLVPVADALMEAITTQMAVAFTDLNRDSPQVVLRLCKHLMQTLTGFFDHKTLGKAVSTTMLTTLLGELTGRLLDTAEDLDNEAISSLSKVLNMVLIRIFHHSDQTACFSALLSVLQEATVDLRELRGAELAERAKYAELVMKCLWKVSKTVKESLEAGELSASLLLRDINNFLDATPPAEWRRRSTDGIPLQDMPLRTVKTILQQIVTVYGEQVFDHLEEISAAENSYVYQYLFRLASTSSESNGRDVESIALTRAPSAISTASADPVDPPTRPAPVVDSPVSVRSPTMEESASNSAASPRGLDIEMNNRLKEIFDLIGDPSRSRQGIEDLYEYQKAHPEAAPRITHWMSGTGNYFQTYLRRALENLASADRERSSLPTSPDPSSRTPSASSRPRPDSGSSDGTTPRRHSGQNGTRTSAGASTPARLQELKSIFGYTASTDNP